MQIMMFNQGFYQNSGLIIFTEMILNLFPFLLWFQKSESIPDFFPCKPEISNAVGFN